jgi:hypothetical protein
MDEKPREQCEDSRQRGELDARYGKIGISAVAAAVRCKGEQRRPVNETRFAPERE